MNAGLFTRRLLSHKPTVRNVAVRNASNIKQCRSSKNYNDNNNTSNNNNWELVIMQTLFPYERKIEEG